MTFGLVGPPVISAIKALLFVGLLRITIPGSLAFEILAEVVKFSLNLDPYLGSGASFLNYSTNTMRLFILDWVF